MEIMMCGLPPSMNAAKTGDGARGGGLCDAKSLEAFYLKHSTHLQATIENKRLFISNLLQILSEQSSAMNQRAGDGDGEWQRSITLLAYVIDCIRICLRQKNEIDELVSREFVDHLMSLSDAAAATGDLLIINLSTAALRCLTNLLNLNSVAVDLFLSLNGLTWLLSKLQNEGHIVHCYYSIRLLYMLISQRYMNISASPDPSSSHDLSLSLSLCISLSVCLCSLSLIAIESREAFLPSTSLTLLSKATARLDRNHSHPRKPSPLGLCTSHS
jgi:hypothetical protein